MTKVTKVTGLQQAEAVELLGEKTVKEVAEMYNVSISTVNRWKKSHAQPQPQPEPQPEPTSEPQPQPEPQPEPTSEPASKFNYEDALRGLVLRINFLKGTEFLTNSEIKKVYAGNNPVKILADAYQQEGNVSLELATKVASYFLGTEDESIIGMIQTLLNHAYSCRSKSVYRTDWDGKRIKEMDKDGKNHLIPTGLKDMTYIGLCQYKKMVINGLFSIYENSTIELDSNKVKREKANLLHSNKCEGITSKRGGKKVK